MPPLRLLELSRAIGDGAGERALHVPEQLALDQLARDRGAVHLDERPRRRAATAGASRAPRAPCPVPFSPVISTRAGVGATFSILSINARMRERLADDLVARLESSAEPRVLLLQVQVLQRVAQRDEDAVGVERLLEKVVRAELRRLDRRLDRARGR